MIEIPMRKRRLNSTAQILSFLAFSSSLSGTNGIVVPVPFVHTGIGAIAGGVGALAVYPIDYVKTQLQTAEGSRYEDGFDAFASIVERDGPLALYRGAGTQVVGVAPEKTIKLLVNDAARTAITASLGFLPFMGEVVAGMTAGACQVIVTNPLEVMKVGLQTSSMSITELFADVGGIRGLYKGGFSCVCRDATFSAVLFPLYAHSKVLLPEMLGLTGPLVLALAGTLAATPAAYLTTPMDVVKTRQQSLEEEKNKGKSREEADMGTFEVAGRIIQEEGVDVLFSGGLERVLRSAPQFGVTLALFDILTKMAVENGILPA